MMWCCLGLAAYFERTNYGIRNANGSACLRRLPALSPLLPLHRGLAEENTMLQLTVAIQTPRNTVLMPGANMARALDGDLDTPLSEILEAIAVLGARHLTSTHYLGRVHRPAFAVLV